MARVGQQQQRWEQRPPQGRPWDATGPAASGRAWGPFVRRGDTGHGPARHDDDGQCALANCTSVGVQRGGGGRRSRPEALRTFAVKGWPAADGGLHKNARVHKWEGGVGPHGPQDI